MTATADAKRLHADAAGNQQRTAWAVAHNAVHHAPGRASHLELPVVTPPERDAS